MSSEEGCTCNMPPKFHADDCPLSSQRRSMTDVLQEIAAERERQLAKGYDAAHDDAHCSRGIIRHPEWGAIQRLQWALGNSGTDRYCEELIKVAAMIVAEIERDRRVVRK